MKKKFKDKEVVVKYVEYRSVDTYKVTNQPKNDPLQEAS